MEFIDILIVDDNADVRDMFKHILPKELNVATAATLHEAKSLISERQFKVIVVDISLPDGYGYSLIPQILQTQKDTNVLIFTAIAHDPELRRILHEYNIPNIYAKPVDTHKLLLHIRSYIE